MPAKHFYPSSTETFVLAITPGEVALRLRNAIAADRADGGQMRIRGEADERAFLIWFARQKPDNFSPQIAGTLEATPQGSLLFLRYDLFPAARRLLATATAMTLFLTLFFSLLHGAHLYALIAFSFGLVNYRLSRESFRSRVKKSRRLLAQLLEPPAQSAE
jgi:hypothetical protein